MAKDRPDFASSDEDLTAAIVDIARSLDHDQLETLTIESILEHRQLLDTAQTAYEALKAAERDDVKREDLRQAYTRAMIAHKAKMAVVAVLVDHLGYVPKVPGVAS